MRQTHRRWLVGTRLGRIAWRDRSDGRKVRRGRTFAPEPLETRELLSTVTEYSLPTVNGKNAAPQAIVSAAGKLWYADPANNLIGMIDPADPAHPQTITQGLPTNPAGNPTEMVVGPDGNLWFTLTHGIGMLNTADPSHTITVITAANGAQGIRPNALPQGITAGQDGKIWFTDAFSDNDAPRGALGWIDPAHPTAVVEYAIPANLQGFALFGSQITAGPNGSLWFTEAKLNSAGALVSSAIGALYPTAPNPWLEIAMPAGRVPRGIAMGSDGNIWITDRNTGNTTAALGVINLSAGSPNITEIPLTKPTGGQVPNPFRIAAGPDGQLWFPDSSNQAIMSINPVSRNIQTYGITNPPKGAAVPQELTIGPDGNVWFSDALGAFGVVSLDTQLVVTTPPAVYPGALFSVTATIQYSGTGVTKQYYNGPVTVALASNPGGAVLGGALTVQAVNGVATFNGLTINNVANGYTLVVTAAGQGSAATGGFAVSQSTPQQDPPTVIGAQVLFTRKINRRGRPVGRPVFSGFQITFSTAMDGSAGSAANYQVGLLTTRRVGRKRVQVVKPVGFSASYDAASHSVKIVPAGRQTFRTGGRITLLAAGLRSAAGLLMSGDVVYNIARNARSIARG